MEKDNQKEIKIERLPTYGKPLSLKTGKWKQALTPDQKDLEALKKTIKANDEKASK